MESFASPNSAISAEGNTNGTAPSSNSQPSTRLHVKAILKTLGFKLLNSAWVGVAGIVLAASVIVTQVQTAQAASYVRVSSGVSALNVRHGPGTGYGLYGRALRPGETVRVVNSSGGWYQLPDGGWFSSAYTGSAGNSGGTGGGGAAVNRVVTATTTVNVRSGPGVGYALNGRPLYSGERVRVIRQSNGWYQLPDGGWFSSSYTTAGSSGGVGGGGSGTVLNRDVRISTYLNVRSGPGTGYRIIGSLSPGETVRVTGLSNGWYQTPDGRWFASNYAYTTSNASTAGFGGGGSYSSARVATNGSGLLIRSSPGGAVIGSLANGAVVRLSGQRSGSYVQLSSGGWVSRSWLG